MSSWNEGPPLTVESLEAAVVEVPPVCVWPKDAVTWCQRCDRPIHLGRPYEPIRDDRGLCTGRFRHKVCLAVVR